MMLKTELSTRLRNILSGESLPANTKEDVIVEVPAGIIAEAIAEIEATNEFEVEFTEPKYMRVSLELLKTLGKEVDILDETVTLNVTGFLVRGDEFMVILSGQ